MAPGFQPMERRVNVAASELSAAGGFPARRANGAGERRRDRGAVEGGGRSAARLDARRRHGRGGGGAVSSSDQRARGHAALRAWRVGRKQQWLRGTVPLESWLQSRLHRLRQERHQAAPGWIAGHGGRRQQSQSRHRSVDRALHQRGAWRERADLRREHAGRRHRFHLPYRAQERAALGVPQQRQPWLPERSRHGRRRGRRGRRTPDGRRQELGRLSRSQRSGTLGPVCQRRLAAFGDDQRSIVRDLRP